MDSWNILGIFLLQIAVGVPFVALMFLLDWAMKHWYAVQAVLRF
jgi:hypothetical protein